MPKSKTDDQPPSGWYVKYRIDVFRRQKFVLEHLKDFRELTNDFNQLADLYHLNADLWQLHEDKKPWLSDGEPRQLHANDVSADIDKSGVAISNIIEKIYKEPSAMGKVARQLLALLPALPSITTESAVEPLRGRAVAARLIALDMARAISHLEPDDSKTKDRDIPTRDLLMSVSVDDAAAATKKNKDSLRKTRGRELQRIRDSGHWRAGVSTEPAPPYAVLPRTDPLHKRTR